jgi:CDP-diglyceride synthetase
VFGRLTKKAQMGLIGGVVVTAMASATAFNRSVENGVIMTVLCVLAVAVAVTLVQLVTRPSRP